MIPIDRVRTARAFLHVATETLARAEVDEAVVEAVVRALDQARAALTARPA